MDKIRPLTKYKEIYSFPEVMLTKKSFIYILNPAIEIGSVVALC